MKLVQDQDQFNRFVNLLPELKAAWVYFLSMSARQKYLTTEERAYFDLGRTEMFARVTADSKINIQNAMDKMEGMVEKRTTRNGKTFPPKALVCYANLNPSCMIAAYNLFQSGMNDELAEIMSALQNGRQPEYKGIKQAERKLMNCVQKSRAAKLLIDIDIDAESPQPMYEITAELRDHNVLFATIKTKSGYHVVINVASLNKGRTRLHEIVQRQNDLHHEVKFNENGMIPVPGTMQAGHMVHFVN
jgi:hypothetical protein